MEKLREHGLTRFFIAGHSLGTMSSRWLAVSLAFGAINLLYVVMFLAGLDAQRLNFWRRLFVFVLRSAFLGSLENPEPRYTLECYPAVLLLASSLFHRGE